jgi:hypothetical protein
MNPAPESTKPLTAEPTEPSLSLRASQTTVPNSKVSVDPMASSKKYVCNERSSKPADGLSEADLEVILSRTK